MNVGKILNELAAEKAGDTAFIFEETVYTYRTLEETVDRYAGFLAGLGVVKGTKVALYLPNIPAYVFAYYALFKIGATAVPLDHRLRTDEVIALLNHSEAGFLLTGPRKDFQPAEIRASAPGLKKILIARGRCAGCINVEEQMPAATAFRTAQIKDEDTAAIFYTSGTTGAPKGVIWTYKHLESPTATMKFYNYFRDDEMGLCPVPLSHNGGLCAPLLILEQIPMLLTESFHPLDILHNLVRHRITFTFLVPSLFSAIVHLKEFETSDLSALRWISIFGAPGGQELVRRFRAHCPKTMLVAGYGLTETAAPNVLMPQEKVKPGSVGKPVPWVDVKLVDETGGDVPAGEIGEILMKGWPVTPGYYKQPDATAEVIKDGWLYTGDYGKFDPDGYLYIVGRKKEVVIVGGLNVFAPEVEGVLLRHPKIREAAVVGVPDRLRGEAVKAVIVPKEGEQISEFDVKHFCNEYLARYKVPTVIEFRKGLPKTGSGKIRKELLS